MRLIKARYGSYKEILEMPTDVVMLAVEYEEFLVKYESRFHDLNKE